MAGNEDAARVRDRLQPRRNVDAITIVAGFVVDNVADVDAYAELHAPLQLACSVALAHFRLDRNRAFERVHDAGELGENAVAGGIDDATAELDDHRQHDRLVRLEVPYGSRLVGTHQRAVTGNIRGENRDQSAINLGSPGPALSASAPPGPDRLPAHCQPSREISI